MFQKVLIAEDFDIINSGLKATLEKMQIPEISHIPYCDEAFLKLKKAKLEGNPFDLLITDLSFVEDHHKQDITSGEALIENVRKEFPTLKIIVFSVEDKPFRIQHLYNNLKIDAYVWKNRNGQKELEKAILQIYKSKSFYISEDLREAIHPKKAIEITEYDIHIIEHLSKGILQDNLPELFVKKQIKPSSKSSIEKRLKFLKEHFNAKNPTHLVAIAKDFGLV
ncbi:response regulator transcription factor [Polaribacter aestuariivivens]|uniref:Response regulator transcription factor n=1 Tax=Polaribacter aestuariivivens TaxID=2304626 RepID=A0A5S3N110_9FLAO|nr:response regulator [Polaribacter aestuariivivens]TMM28667.1 response regulator transcription factor [Polaribacter aestuariivivens]